jgi:hypothetical protein
MGFVFGFLLASASTGGGRTSPANASPPARVVAVPGNDEAGISQSTYAGDLALMFTLTPGRPGLNEITLMYFPAGGQLPEAASVVSFTLTFLEHEPARFVVSPTESHQGHAYLRSDHLRHAGRWRVEALLRREVAGDLKVAFDVVIQ